MKIIFFPFLIVFSFAQDPCSDFDCVNEQLLQLNVKVGTLENQNEQCYQNQNVIRKKLKNFETENKELTEKIENLTKNVGELENDVVQLEMIVRPGKIPVSCQEHFDRGASDNGVYQIKPNVEIEPFYVSCDFSTDQPTTIIKHDHGGFGITSTIGQSDGCDEAGCFEVKISYESEIDQIKTLIDISERCEQRIINNCTGNAISNFAWWTDLNGNQLEYWDGNHPEGTEGCKCHLDGDGCNENAQGDSYFCNCDAAGEFDIDYGTLTNKQQLPVLQLNYGGSVNRFSWIRYQLDYLKCYGKAEGVIYPSEQNQNRIENIENDIEDLSVEIESVKGRTCISELITNHRIMTIPTIYKGYVLKLDVKPIGPMSGWRSILHFTATGEADSSPGSRIPAIWVRPDSINLAISNHLNENGNNVVNPPAIEANTWNTLKIQQLHRYNDTYEYSVELNGAEVFNEINKSAQEWNDVKVYHSAKAYPAASYLIRNLQFESKPEF